MSKTFKPMNAEEAPEDFKKITYPVLASGKRDGIRALRPKDMTVVTKSFKPIPNRHIASQLDKYLPTGFDGEVMTKGDRFNDVSSKIMSRDGEPDFEFWVFDYFQEDILDMGFMDRLGILSCFKSHGLPSWIKFVPQTTIYNAQELKAFESKCLEEGHEGVMIRSLDGPYKCGRSTIREGYMLKIKKFHDAEGIVVGFKEQMHNANKATKDALGRTKRSSHKANMIGKNVLGALVIEFNGYTTKVGSGFTDAERAYYWEVRNSLIGEQITFKYQKSGGKDKPRFASFKCFRKDI